MPIAPGPVTQPPTPAPQNVVPLGQRALPIEPARRVTPSKDSGKASLESDKRRRPSNDRGGTLDLEV